MPRFRTHIALAALVAAPLIAWTVGGWATISVLNLPDSIVAGEPTNMTFAVRQHGEDLLPGLKPMVRGVAGSREFAARAVETNRPGYYTVTLDPKHTGDWTFTIYSGFGHDDNDSKLKLMPIVAVTSAARPVALSHEQRGRRLFVAKGCVSCHLQKGVEPIETRVGRIDLTDRQLSSEYLHKVLADPSVKKSWQSNWKMPNPELQPAEIAALVAFLQSRRGQPEVTAGR